MSASRIANRYAKSLLDLAVEQNELSEVLGDVEGLKKSLESRDFYLFLKSPVIQSERKKAILGRIFDGQLSKVSMAFVRRVAAKGRESLLPEILDAFTEQYRALMGISEVTLITATPISEALVERIKDLLEKSSETRKSVDLNVEINPDLIGGFVIDFDDRQYDASVRYKLSELKKAYT